MISYPANNSAADVFYRVTDFIYANICYCFQCQGGCFHGIFRVKTPPLDLFIKTYVCPFVTRQLDKIIFFLLDFLVNVKKHVILIFYKSKLI